MNTEDRLRHASQEIDRATASLCAPSIDGVHRTARMQGFGVAAVAAVGVLILVGGAVLALNPGGESLPGPAGPNETTTTTIAPLSAPDLATLVVRAEGNIPISFEPAGAEIPFEPLDASEVEADLAAFDELDDYVVFDVVDEVVVLGRAAGKHLYVLRGTWRGAEAESNLRPRPGECLVVVESGTASMDSCAGTAELSRFWMGRTGSGAGEYAIGRAPVMATVVAVRTVDGESWQESWQAPSAGYWAIPLGAPSKGRVFFTAFDDTGTPIFGPTALRSAEDLESADSCSGSGISPSALALSSVPQSVAQTLWEMVEAAQVCDFNALETVAGPNFTASFGGGDPAELWAYEEENGYEPMAWLMKVLDLPHGTREVDGKTLYIWPAAAAHDGEWDTMPEEYVDDLRDIYSEDDFEGFRQFGAYIGYRVGIYENGDWSFFVAGD